MENIIFTNGVKNSLSESLIKRDLLSKMFDAKVYLHHNPSMFLFTALFESFYSRWLYKIRPLAIVKRLTIRIEDAILKNPNEKIYVIGHSQGCVMSMNALRLLKPEYRSRIRAIMIAPTNTQEPKGVQVEYWLNTDDWVISHLIRPKWRRGPVFKRKGKGHSLDTAYLNVLRDFEDHKKSMLWSIIRNKETINEKVEAVPKGSTGKDHTTNESWMD